MNGKITGLGLWAWILSRIENGSVAQQAEAARRLGASRVYVKVSDGTASQNGAHAAHLASALAEEGVAPWAWAYVYDNEAGVHKLLARAQEIGAHGIILNIEKQFADGETQSDGALLDRMLRVARQAWNGPIGVSSYGRIANFPSFPWHVLRHHDIVGMPQVYGYKSPLHARERVRAAVLNYARLGLKCVIPTCGVWVDESFDHSPEEVSAFISETGVLGVEGRSQFAVDAWSWQHIEKHPDRRQMEETLATACGLYGKVQPASDGLLPKKLDDAADWMRRAAMMRIGRWTGPLFGRAPEWTTCVKAFQLDQGLAADGLYGPKTHAALLKVCEDAGAN